ncbi:MAG: hypothetical protein R2844_10755 [Caldilineales bacterium]
MRTDFDAQWEQLAEEVMSGMKEWRLQHPRASLREIESALDERLGSSAAQQWLQTQLHELRQNGPTAP